MASRRNPKCSMQDSLMAALITNRGFQRIWQDAALAIASSTTATAPGALSSPRHESKASTSQAMASQVVMEIADTVHLAVETFLRALPMAIMSSTDKLTRETAALYSVRVQVDRLMSLNSELDLPQLRLAARRVNYVLKNFISLVSSPFPVISCSFYASSLCEVLYRFEDLCAVHEDLVLPATSSRLRSAIDSFHSDVVKRLSNSLLQRRATQLSVMVPGSTVTTSGLGSSLTNLSCFTGAGAPCAMAPTVVFKRSPKPNNKSFLLTPELQAARARVKRARSVVFNRPGEKAALISGIERRWKNLLSDDAPQVLKASAGRKQGSTGDDEASRIALQAACRLTRDVVEEIARRVDRL